MRRNEKILVYGVTGFLLAILVIAVVFGNEDLTRAVEARSQPAQPRTLEEILAAGEDEVPEGAEAPPGGTAVGGGTEPQPARPADNEGAGEPFIGPLPLVAAPPKPEEPVPSLGVSRREGDYRVVTVQPQDTFSQLVLHWCGSPELEGTVERLNEGLDKAALRPGTELWLPWVDDETLLAAVEERQSTRAQEEQVREQVEGRVYTLRRGDSLWKLAEAAVGAGGAPAYIERIKALNPDIPDFDRLREGQPIRLPVDRRP